MVCINCGSLIREDVPRLAKENEIFLRHSITNEGCEILAKVLQTTTTLKELVFYDVGVIALKNNKFIEALAKNHTIKLLYLAYGTRCGDEGAKAIAAVLKENSSIEEIGLSYNRIGANGAKALAGALKTNKALQLLDLGRNNIGDDGAVAMADALKENTTLKTLSLYWNKIEEKGGSAILNALQQNRSSSIESIDLSGNKVSEGTQKKIDEEIKIIKNSNMDDGQGGKETFTRGFDGAVNERSINATGQLTMPTVDANLVGASNEDAQINTERGDEIADTEIELKEQELQSAVSRLQRELKKKDRLVATQDEEIASMNTILRKIGDMVNNKSALDSSPASPALFHTYLTNEVPAEYLCRKCGDLLASPMQVSCCSRMFCFHCLSDDNNQCPFPDCGREFQTVSYCRDIEDTICNLSIHCPNNCGWIGALDDLGVHKQLYCHQAQANHGGHDTQREIDDLRSVIDHYKTEIDSLKEQLKNSKPIETVDLTNEVEPSSATEDISNDEEPPSKRRRTKSNLANALEQSQQMVAVKEEAVQRAAAAEANAETARREKDAVEASLRNVQEDLEIQQETTEQVAVTLDTWQSRFDAVCGLAEAAGVDAAVLRSIREGSST